MSLTIHSSIEVTQLLERLFKGWEAWDQNRSFYIHTLLPDLMAHPNKGTNQESAIIRELKKVSTTEEWKHLEDIAEHLQDHQRRNREVSAILDQYFEVNNFIAAENYINRNMDPASLAIFEQKKRASVSKVWRQVHIELDNFDFQRADQQYATIQRYLSDKEIQEYLTLVENQRKALVQSTLTKIKAACHSYNFPAVEQLYSKISNWVSRDSIDQLIAEAKRRQAEEERMRYVAALVTDIQSLLKQYKFSEADEKYAQIKDEYEWEDYKNLVHTYRRQQEREKLLASIQAHFKNYRFASADQLFLTSDLIEVNEYIQLKSPILLEFIQKRYGQKLVPEKADALAHPGRNLLLSARAGSGKTTVLACKASLLIDTQNIHPDQILVMAFNTTAAKEIGDRIRGEYKQPGFVNARTFHSLAKQLVNPFEDILYDENDDVATRKMSLFIQQLVKEEIRNPVFIEKMYAFFRKEMREIDRAGFLLDDESYFDFRRNMLQITLGGEKVKSTGEKYIADFLFEYDLSYRYEKVWLWGSQIYRPDFSIYEAQKDFVIEHWGIDEFDPQKQVPPEWTQSWDEYYSEMQAKRDFWKEKSITLIETSIRDLKYGREAFESILEKRLTEAGIVLKKLTDLELFQKIKDRDYTITKLASLFTQFIQKAKKQLLLPSNVQQMLQSYQPRDEREAVFVDLACRVYMEYEQALKRQKKMDFDDLMMRAIEKIHATQGECEIWLGHPKSRPVKMNTLRWILIDEYQDFSQLFYELIAAIRKYNSGVRVFCVGDDWQAINGFAGSDLKYFYSFQSWIEDASVNYLSTNFRSHAEIVRNGNALMRGKGKPAEALQEKPGGVVYVGWMDDRSNWIEMRNDASKAALKAEHEKFLITSLPSKGNGKKHYHVVASKYLRRCYEIITSPANIGQKVAILSRTGRIDGIRLSDFKTRLLACLSKDDLEKISNPKQLIDVQTAHKYKGLQADLVIILSVTDGEFPLLHPDNTLFAIFGKTLADAYAEELRLFYVALTRAKSSVYILTEKHRESVFLDRLPAYRPARPRFIDISFTSPFNETELENNYEEISF